MPDIVKYDLPPYLATRARRPEAFKDMKAGLAGTPQPPRISIYGNQFSIIEKDGAKFSPETVRIKAIILAANPIASRMYFEKDFDPKNPNDNPPTCWSDNGHTPSADVTSKQSPSCDACEWAVWGSERSKITGKGKPRCSTHKKIAIIPIDYRDTPYLLGIPPMSGANWREFIDWCEAGGGGQNSIYPEDIVIEIFFVSTGVMGFTPKGWLTEEQAALRDTWIDSPEVRTLLKLDDAPVYDEKPVKQNGVVRREDGFVAAPKVVKNNQPAQRGSTNTFTSADLGGHPGGGDPNYVPPGEPVNNRLNDIQSKLAEAMAARRQT